MKRACGVALWLLLPSAVVAQVIVVDEPTGARTPSLLEKLDVDVVALTSSSPTLSRSSFSLEIGYAETLLDGKLELAGAIEAATSDLNLTAELRSSARRQRTEGQVRFREICGNQNYATPCADWTGSFEEGVYGSHLDLTDEQEFQIEPDAAVELSTLSLRYTPVDAVQVTAGITSLSVGQFGFLSPVQLLLPITLYPEELSYEKDTFLLEQQMAVLDLYPTEAVQLSLGVMGATAADPFLQEWAERNLDRDDVTIEGDTQTLARALYTGGNGAFGLTYYKGNSVFDYASPATLQRTVVESQNVRTPPAPLFRAPNGQMYDIERRVEYAWETVIPNDIDTVALPEREGFGFEFSYRISDATTFIVEITQAEETSRLFSEDDIFYYACVQYLSSTELADTNFTPADCDDYQPVDPTNTLNRNQYENNNEREMAQRLLSNYVWENYPSTVANTGDPSPTGYNGALNLPSTLVLGGVGLEHQGRNWNYAVSLLFYEDTWDDAELQRLYEDYEPDSESSGVFPSLLFDRKHTVFGRPAHLFFGLGFFGQYAGVFSTWTGEVYPNLNLSAGIEVVTNPSNDNAIESETDGDYYEFTGNDPAAVFSLSYSY